VEEVEVDEEAAPEVQVVTLHTQVKLLLEE
jgi:hypothetical protein